VIIYVMNMNEDSHLDSMMEARFEVDIPEEDCCLDDQASDFSDGDNLSDVEADSMTLASAGMGMDEDYEHGTPMEEFFGGE